MEYSELILWSKSELKSSSYGHMCTLSTARMCVYAIHECVLCSHSAYEAIVNVFHAMSCRTLLYCLVVSYCSRYSKLRCDTKTLLIFRLLPPKSPRKTFTVCIICISLFRFFLSNSLSLAALVPQFDIVFPHNLCISKWVRTFIYILSILQFFSLSTDQTRMRVHGSVCAVVRTHTRIGIHTANHRFNCAETTSWRKKVIADSSIGHHSFR